MTVTILTGDCRDILKALPAESVHCVVTSPPYWGLRDYGTATWEGGDPNCDHAPERRGGRFATPVSVKQASNTGSGSASRQNCDCGARRIDSQLGLEPSLADYVAGMVEVFHEVRRVLRPDGTLWLNLGDSYCAAGGQTTGYNDPNWIKTGGACNGGPRTRVGQSGNKGNPGADHGFRVSDPILKPKDLCGIPWRVAFALQADGWYLRQDIIWSKPNPMPESVRDRCTKAHEYIFLMAKSERYYYDAEAIREDHAEPKGSGGWQSMARRGESGWHAKYPKVKVDESRNDKESANDYEYGNGRNKRSVWEISTAPFPEAHFATFPPALIEPCILAGCPKRGTVLDPFGGAGTTGLVADRLGRNAILIELNPAYAEMAERRLRDDAGMFAEISREQPDDYDAQSDIEGSFSEAYRAIRERKAAGGPGWEPK